MPEWKHHVPLLPQFSSVYFNSTPFISTTYKVYVQVTPSLLQALCFLGNELLLDSKCFTGRNQILIDFISLILSTQYSDVSVRSVRGIGQGNWSWKVLNTVKRVKANNDIETRGCSCGKDFNPHNIHAIIQCNLSSWQFFFSVKSEIVNIFCSYSPRQPLQQGKWPQTTCMHMYANGLAGFSPWAMVWPLLTWFKACYFKNFTTVDHITEVFCMARTELTE